MTEPCASPREVIVEVSDLKTFFCRDDAVVKSGLSKRSCFVSHFRASAVLKSVGPEFLGPLRFRQAKPVRALRRGLKRHP